MWTSVALFVPGYEKAYGGLETAFDQLLILCKHSLSIPPHVTHAYVRRGTEGEICYVNVFYLFQVEELVADHMFIYDAVARVGWYKSCTTAFAACALDP